MIINKENIEAYLLLLIDGELSAAEEREVMAFVENNEVYRLMLDAYLDAKLEPEPVVFDGKESLLKEVPKLLPLRKNKQYMAWAAALAIIAGIGFILKMMTQEEPSMPRTIAVNHPSALKPDTSIKQSLAVLPTSKIIEKKPDHIDVSKAKKTTVVAAIANNTAPVKSSVDALEPLPVADYRVAHVADVPLLPATTIALSKPVEENTITPEKDNRLFGNSDKLDLVNALVDQMETMKDNVQEKTKSLRIAAVAIHFGNKEYTIGKSFK